MKILLTGANGYLGRYVKTVLNDSELEYVTLSHIELKQWNPKQITDFLKENAVTDIIHLSAAVGNMSLDEIFESNVIMLYNLLQGCKEGNIKHFVFASSNNVYSSYKDQSSCETDACDPIYSNAYGISKYIGECLIEDFCKHCNMGYSIVRIADIYGPKQKTGNLMKALVRSIALGESLKLYGEGTRKRDYIYVTDAAQGMLHICKNRIDGKINLGTGIATSVKELVDIACRVSGNKCGIERISVTDEDKSSIYLNVDKLKKSGFYPRIMIEQGMRLCVEEEMKCRD